MREIFMRVAMDIVDGRRERYWRALNASLRNARQSRGIPAEKVFERLQSSMRHRAKLRMMPKPYVRKSSLPSGYLFHFKDVRGIGVPKSLTLI